MNESKVYPELLVKKPSSPTDLVPSTLIDFWQCGRRWGYIHRVGNTLTPYYLLINYEKVARGNLCFSQQQQRFQTPRPSVLNDTRENANALFIIPYSEE